MDIRMSNIASPMPQIRAKFTNKLGIPLSGCKVYTYEPNSNIPKKTWIDIDKTVENTNPILLDSAGEADIFLDGLYRIVVKDRFGFVVYDVEKTGTHTEWDASFVVDGDKNQHQINEEQRELNNLLLLGTVSTYVITPETHTDISDVLAEIPENSTVIIKNGDYTASGVQIEKNNFKIEMQDGVDLTLKAGANGIFIRFGKRGPMSDTHEDNLPQFNGAINYWDESQYSPASESYPRYENIGVSGGTIILDNSNGVGNSTGVDFYRCDNPLLETEIKWSSKFSFGNAVRVWFCKDMQSRYLKIDDNENSIFTMLYYWSYGLRAGQWDIGAGQDTSMEFKHSVDGYVGALNCRGSGGSSKAFNIGYGSINNTIDRVVAKNGSVRIKASEEFDLTRNVIINDLDIDNAAGTGLNLIHVLGLRIPTYKIRAKAPLLLASDDYYVTSSARVSTTPVQSTGEFIYDGDYRTSLLNQGFTKYFEKRPLPVLKDTVFGVGELIATAGATQVFMLNISGGIVPLMTSTGKLRRFEAGSVRQSGHDESKRFSYQYEYSAPLSLDNVDFGTMTLKAEVDALSTIVAMAQTVTAFDKCKGAIRTFADKKSLQFIWMFDSDITLETNRFLTNPSGFVVEMDSMVRSTLRGKWLANGRAFNFKGGSSIYYTDGYVDHKLAGKIIRQSTPASTPPLYTNFSAATNTWKPIALDGLKIYAEDGSSTAGDISIIKHNGSLPTGITNQNGTGYVANNACMQDHNVPFRRGFSDASTETSPPLTPNFVGEYAVNLTTNTWWKANSPTAWSKL